MNPGGRVGDADSLIDVCRNVEFGFEESDADLSDVRFSDKEGEGVRGVSELELDFLALTLVDSREGAAKPLSLL